MDTDVPAPSPEVWVTPRSNDVDSAPVPGAWGFARSTEILVPSLLDLPARTRGDFTDFMVDLHAPFFPDHPNHVYEVDLRLRGKVIDTKVFRNFTQRHQYIISTQLLFEETNVLTLSARLVSGGTEQPRFILRTFLVQTARLIRILERNSIWVFSTARSGSTWLSQDLLCGAGQMRPMDEPGFGRMFAPFDWAPERVYDLAKKATYVESGFDYETRVKTRDVEAFLPPFERAFVYSRRENQIASAQNWTMFLGILKQTVFRHVMNEWGMIGYRDVVFKMPNDSHAADVIMQAFPESFMIFLMRDGRDVMKSRFSPFASAKLAGTTDQRLRRYAIAFYSHFWNFQIDIIHAAFIAHSPERSLLVYYEDLRRNTLAQLRIVFDRIGIPITDDQLAELASRTSLELIPDDQKGHDKPRQTGQIGRYSDVFSEPEIELMEAIMGPNLQRFGYASYAETQAGREA